MALRDLLMGWPRRAPGADAPAPASIGERVLRKTAQAFEIGRRGRRLTALPASTVAINTLIRTYGNSTLARSRYLAANNGYVASAKAAYTSSLVGYGIKPSTLGETAADKEQIQQLWLDWTKEADFDGVTSFYGLQELGAAELFEAGEFFVVRHDAPKNKTVPLRLRLLPAEMLPYELTWARGVAPGNYVYMGIEFNAAGERVAYHFRTRHPGDHFVPEAAVFGHETMRIPADQVLHVFKPLRVGQVRGVPRTLAGLVTMAMLDLYDDAELERKRVAALFAAFVTYNPKEGEDPDSPLGPVTGYSGAGAGAAGTLDIGEVPSRDSSFRLEPGLVTDLMPGENIVFSEPADVGGSYDAFQYRTLLRAASGFGVPYAAMTGDLRGASYGSQRAGMIEFKRRVTSEQYNFFIPQFCEPVWQWFHDIGVARTNLFPWKLVEYLSDRIKHLRAKWITPRWDWIDPKKDLEAEVIAVTNRMKSRSDVIEEMGSDPEETDRRILADQEREEELGIVSKPVAPPAAPEPDPEDEDPDNPDNPDNDNPDEPPRRRPEQEEE